jgi:hypothetical protein
MEKILSTKMFEEEVLPPCLPDMSNAPCRLTESQSQSLEETITSQQSLEDAQKTKAPRDAEAAHLAAFMRLSPEQKTHFFQKALDDSSGDFGAVDHSERNRASLKAAQRPKKPSELKREGLEKQIKETFNVSDDQLDKFVDVVFEAIESRAETVAFENKIRELFESSPYYSLMFADDETIDAVELLSNQINRLVESLALAAEERAMLEEEILERQSALSEETLFAATRQTAKRRSLDPDFIYNEEGEFLMEDGTQRHQSQSVADPRMRRYVDVLTRSTKHVDVVSPAQTLVETWQTNN